MFYLFLLFVLGQVFCKLELRLERADSWDYINLHCRDNDNAPVDWWILYKPPSGTLPSEIGLNFSYISSVEAGKWIPSNRLITSNSMLTYTLAPMYRRTYQDHLAMVTYSPKPGTNKQAGSAARGLLLADELSGIWISHTVPGLPDITRDRLHFPEDELMKGHLIVCLSAEFNTLNGLARHLREVDPYVMTVRMPESVKKWLPDFMLMSQPIPNPPMREKSLPKTFDYVTVDKTLQAQVMVRQPGDDHCLYQMFATTNNIVLDVYGHHKRKPAICDKNYGVRKIEAISLNYPNRINDNTKSAQVVYVNNQSDRLEFAVSTAAHWQRGGSTKHPKYWTCIGSSAVDDALEKGGLIICMENYEIWRSFDLLKIKEPRC